MTQIRIALRAVVPSKRDLPPSLSTYHGPCRQCVFHAPTATAAFECEVPLKAGCCLPVSKVYRAKPSDERIETPLKFVHNP